MTISIRRMTTHSTCLLLLLAGSGKGKTADENSPEVQGGKLQTRLIDAATKASNTIKNAVGITFDKQIEDALSALKPDSDNNTKQLAVVRLLMQKGQNIRKALSAMQESGLKNDRDSLIIIYERLLDKTQTEIESTLTKAKDAPGDWSARYRQLADAMKGISGAYSFRLSKIKEIPVELWEKETIEAIKYCDTLDTFLTTLHTTLTSKVLDGNKLEELQRLFKELNTLHSQVLQFANTVSSFVSDPTKMPPVSPAKSLNPPAKDDVNPKDGASDTNNPDKPQILAASMFGGSIDTPDHPFLVTMMILAAFALICLLAEKVRKRIQAWNNTAQSRSALPNPPDLSSEEWLENLEKFRMSMKRDLETVRACAERAKRIGKGYW
jgi:hypothetical protein